MSVETRQIEHKPIIKRDQDSKPVLITWKDQKIIRNHSMLKTCEEIYDMNQNLDVVKVNLIGPPNSGKTEQFKSMAHMIHKIAKQKDNIPYSVKLFEKEDLLNFENTLKRLTPTNWILGFDDISFLKAKATNRQIDVLKQAETEIRHLEGGKDVKIIEFKISHYTLSVDKFLRQNNFTYFTSVGSSEYDNMERIVGAKNMPKVMYFKKLTVNATSKGKYGYQLRKDKAPIVYSYKNPFIPLLFWNEETLRIVESPNRKWLDPYCEVCASSDDNLKTEIIDVDGFIKEKTTSYGNSIFKLAVKNKMRDKGVNTHHPGVVAAERDLERCLATGNVTLDQIAARLQLKPTITKLRKPIGEAIYNTKEPLEVDEVGEILNNDIQEPKEGVIDEKS